MVTLNGKERALRQALRACPISICDNATFLKLTDKSTHDVYRIDVGSDRLVVKQFFQETFTQLNRSAIFNAQKQFSKIGFAPEPIWFDSLEGLWVERFVESHFEACSLEQKFQNLGYVLAKIHDIPFDSTDLPYMDLPSQWNRYFEHIDQDAKNRWYDTLDQCILDYQEFFDEHSRVVCHNDLSIMHILNYSSPVVVDWEYAGIGNRFFDLASTILVNNIPRHLENWLYRGYADHTGLSVEHVSQGVQRMRLSAKLTSGLWFEAKSALPLLAHTYNSAPC